MQNMLSCSFVAMQLRNLAFNFVKSIGHAAIMQIYDHIHDMVVLYGYLYSLQA